MRGKPLSQFERGYLAAVSNLIPMHVDCTEAKDIFVQLGRTLDFVLDQPDLQDFDLENLVKLKGWCI